MKHHVFPCQNGALAFCFGLGTARSRRSEATRFSEQFTQGYLTNTGGKLFVGKQKLEYKQGLPEQLNTAHV